MKIAIIGAGALGGYVGSFLAEAGTDVILYDVRREYVDQVKSEGLTICPAGGKAKEYHPPITAELAEVGAPDVVVIATKAHATRAAIEGVKSIVRDDTLVASFQNGYGNLAVLEEAVGRPERIAAITTAHNFAVSNVTHIAYFMGVGGVDLGMMAGGKAPRLEELAAALKSLRVPVKVHESGPEVVWNKILWNAVLNCTAAVTGMDVITMANIESIKTVFDGLTSEYFAVSKAMGVTVWHPADFVDKIMMGAKMAAKMATLSPPKPSMLQDIEAGRPTEVDFINGAIIRMGEKYNVPTPVNKTMWALVKTIETKACRK